MNTEKLLEKLKNKKVAFYAPYLYELGGGERYLLTVMKFFKEKGFDVDLWVGPEIKTDEIRPLVLQRLGFDLEGIEIIVDRDFGWLRRLGFYPNKLASYGMAFYMVNNLPLISLNPNSAVIIQFPCDGSIKKRPLKRYFKWLFLKKYRLLLVYSRYAAEWTENFWKICPAILYPPCKTFSTHKKKNIILTVGRFSNFKKQKEMIECFKRMMDQGLKGWEFHLLGGLTQAESEYFSVLVNSIQKYPVFLKANADKDELAAKYGEAKIYWHAAGLGEDLEINPQYAEHFGITTVEAMSAGCVPVVIAQGGQPEIVTHEETGLLWKTKEDLIMQTRRVINDEGLCERLSSSAIERSKRFSEAEFTARLEFLLETIY